MSKDTYSPRAGQNQEHRWSIFANLQPAYAARGIPTFPVGDNKTPLVRHYSRVGLQASTKLTRRFADATALGFMAGPPSGVTVLDYDSTEEGGFGDVLSRHGDTPIKIRTASGKFHGLYRHDGERRCVRPFKGLPVDIMGGGFVIAAGSVVPGIGAYEFIEGSLDDLNRLPVLRGLPSNIYVKAKPEGFVPDGAPEGERNVGLWRFCMRAAAETRGRNLTESERFNLVLKAAVDFNAQCQPPLDQGEVMETAGKAWDYERRGNNWFGSESWRPLPRSEAVRMICEDLDAFALCSFLQIHQSPGSEFMIANGLADVLGWTRKRLSEARSRLIERGTVLQVKGHSNFTGAALYKWRLRKGVGGGRKGELSIGGQF
jgi:hypothetical protein